MLWYQYGFGIISGESSVFGVVEYDLEFEEGIGGLFGVRSIEVKSRVLFSLSSELALFAPRGCLLV